MFRVFDEEPERPGILQDVQVVGDCPLAPRGRVGVSRHPHGFRKSARQPAAGQVSPRQGPSRARPQDFGDFLIYFATRAGKWVFRFIPRLDGEECDPVYLFFPKACDQATARRARDVIVAGVRRGQIGNIAGLRAALAMVRQEVEAKLRATCSDS